MKQNFNLPFPSLLQELKDFEVDRDVKIRRVYYKCLKFKHYKWAMAIEDKYPHSFRGSDVAMAMGFALMASKNKL